MKIEKGNHFDIKYYKLFQICWFSNNEVANMLVNFPSQPASIQSATVSVEPNSAIY